MQVLTRGLYHTGRSNASAYTHPVVDEARLGAALSGAGLDGASAVLQMLTPDENPPRAAVDAEAPIYPASMIKVPLAVAVLAAVARGEHALQERVEVSPANMTANDLDSPFVPGYRAPLSELVELMLSASDNVATNVLIDVVGREAATRDLHALGLPGTAIRRKLSGSDPLIDDPEATGRNAHPAAEAALLFAGLARDALPGAGFIRAALGRQRWNGKLSKGLRPEDAFAHKTGDTSQVSHDGGILTTPGGRYVIVVYTSLPSSDETDARFAAFMRALRPQLA